MRAVRRICKESRVVQGVLLEVIHLVLRPMPNIDAGQH